MAGLASQAAFAADLPTKAYRAPPAAAPVANWTGWYVAGGGGYGLYDAESSSAFIVPGPASFAASNGTTGGKGYFGRVQTGYDYQFANTWVLGVFADYDFSSIKGTAVDTSAGLFALNGGLGAAVPLKQTSAYSVGGRIGYLVNPAFLTFFEGGYAHASFKGGAETSTVVAPGFVFGVANGLTLPNQGFSGYFLGGGTEYMILPGWFVKSEYRVANYGSQTTNLIRVAPALAAFTSATYTLKPVVQTVSAELVYKFNWGR